MLNQSMLAVLPVFSILHASSCLIPVNPCWQLAANLFSAGGGQFPGMHDW